jgi:SPP1 gp7 family putative phage head morphogenesis protein
VAKLSRVEAAVTIAGVLSLRGPSKAAVSRAHRQKLHPASPSAVRYLKLMRAYQNEVERLTREILLPALPTTDARPLVMDSSRNLDEAFAELNAQLLAVADSMAPHLGTIARAVTKQANSSVSRMLNIDLRGGERELEPYVQAFIAKNVGLVKSVSFDQLAKLRTIVSEHTGAGGGVKELREKLMDGFGLTRQRAALIAKDQILRAVNELRQKQVGITTYTWSTSSDERVREDHVKLDGQVFDWSNPPVVDSRTGRREHPGADFQCRCVAIANVAGLLGR